MRLRLTVMVLVALALAAPGSAAAARCSATWSAVGHLAGGRLYAVAAASPTDAWAVGDGLGSHPLSAFHWDGVSWLSQPPDMTSAALRSVAALAPDDFQAGGFQSTDTFLLRAHAGGWSEVERESNGGSFESLSFVSPADGWAVGYDGTLHGRVAHWDGSAWTPVAAPNPGDRNLLLGVAALGLDNAWAVGSYDAGGTTNVLIEHWDGSAWGVVGSPSPPDSRLDAVAAVAPDDVWAAGTSFPGGEPHVLIEHWNGLGWSVVPGPSPFFAGLSGIAARSSADVWAVGSFIGGGQNLPLVEHWDGTGWTLVDAGPPPTGFGHDVAVAGARVWLVGDNGTKGRSMIEQLCPAQILDSGFSPKAESVGLGRTASWAIPGSDGRSHSVTDGTGLGLFDSGLRAPGGSFTYTFANAGSYPIGDASGPGRQTVKVPAAASPRSGGTSTTFTVTWASAALPPGYVADVQLKRPSGVFVAWLSGQSTPSASFSPDVGPGIYSFRARLRSTDTGAVSGWSPSTSIRVS